MSFLPLDLEINLHPYPALRNLSSFRSVNIKLQMNKNLLNEKHNRRQVGSLK